LTSFLNSRALRGDRPMTVNAETTWADRTAKAVLLIRILVGWVFLSEGIQKSLFSGERTKQAHREELVSFRTRILEILGLAVQPFVVSLLSASHASTDQVPAPTSN
jgi:hypothetical protein